MGTNKLMRQSKNYSGPYPDSELSLYYRAIYDIFELLDQIYLQHPPTTIFGKENRWEGIESFYKILAIISKKKKLKIPFIVRNVGNC